ncbi:hypothetical protein [Nostoc sp.]|uniref:hypothetical protein n=1 Tax=Nostoc sp. TaxID=1180 RepID=UPI002FFD1772
MKEECAIAATEAIALKATSNHVNCCDRTLLNQYTHNSRFAHFFRSSIKGEQTVNKLFGW